VGSYPIQLKKYFEIVYTFEPNPILFRLLCRNCQAPEIIKIHCALGDCHQMVHMAHEEKYERNMGAWFAEPGGLVPMLMLDDFDFPQVDLLYLDVEGWEGRIFQGAKKTIEKHRPVIIAEYKKKILRFGDWFEDFRRDFNYKQVDQVGSDVCLVSG